MYLVSTLAMFGVPILISEKFTVFFPYPFLQETLRVKNLPRDGSLSSTSTTSCLLLFSSVTSSLATEFCDAERLERKDCGFLFKAGSKEEEPMRLGFRKSRRFLFENKVGGEGKSILGDFSDIFGTNVCFLQHMINIIDFY